MKIITVVGTRPQFIKLSAVTRAIKIYNDSQGCAKDRQINEVVVHTGQHYDYNMSDNFFDELSIPEPNYNLGVALERQGEQTGNMLIRIEEVLIKESPDLVLVYGDTNSTLAGALAAAKLNIPVAHVEAGLRSFNKRMPEEKNRILTDHVSNFLFCPTKTAIRNLRREGLRRGVFFAGDVMYDSILYSQKLIKSNPYFDIERILSRIRKDNHLQNLKDKSFINKSFYLATIHRAENTNNEVRLRKIFSLFEELKLPLLIPLHPRTRKMLGHIGYSGTNSKLFFINPVSYSEMITLMGHAKLICTDSGGVQKEAYFLKRPCITLRDETEWRETVRMNWNRVVGLDRRRFFKAIDYFEGRRSPRTKYDTIKYFGSGEASKEIVKVVVKSFIKGS